MEKNKGGQKKFSFATDISLPPRKLLKHSVVHSFPQSVPHSLRVCV